MATKLTPFSRILITLVILGLLFFGIQYLLNETPLGDKLKSKADQVEQDAKTNSSSTSTDKATSTSSSNEDDVLKVQVFTWGGYAPGIYFNEGLKSSKHSRYLKDYGLKVDFELIDDFDGSRLAWITDEVHLLGNEASAMATEMERLGPHDPQVIMQVDWSRGGDAIIVKRGINSINDLRGKKVAVTPSTPSQTFLFLALEAAGMTLKDIKVIEVPSAIDAATAFKAGNVDGAVVWSPDDVIVTREIAGSKVLQSTREASHVVADVFMVKKAYAEKNADKLAKFYEGWMRAAAELNSNASNMQKAAKILSEGMQLPQEDALGMIQNTRLTNHGDNLNFFGQNIQYKGVTGESLYRKMGGVFEELGFAPKNRPTWRDLSNTRAITAAKLSGKTHLGEGQKEFKPAKVADRVKPAISSRLVSINFPTGSSTLGENAKTIIDIQFAEVAKAYSNSRIRVEGNTDNTGTRALNMKLSEARAKSVANYLMKQYKMNTNRFIIVGNGPDKPVKGCESNATNICKAQNRRTEFQLLAD